MRAPTFHWLAVFTLLLSRSVAVQAEPASRLVTDSGDMPVRGSQGDCWRSSSDSPATMPLCPVAASTPMAAVPAGSEARSGVIVGALAVSTRPPPVETFAAISAGGNPGYVTDSNGIAVRGSQGECWHTGSWSPELATIVGCDGVLSKAMPVPAPAPSPRPRPPAEPATQPPVSATEAPAKPTPKEAATGAAPTAPVPMAPTPEAPPAKASPSGGSEVPAVIPPAPATLTPSTVVPFGESGDAAGTRKMPTEPTSEKIALDTDTYFDFDKATLKPEGKQKLDALAARLSALELEVLVATGHTDWTGTAAYNQHLSERRANAVKNYLAQKGVPSGRIFTDGKGEKQPVASNSTHAGRAQNRRVEVELVAKRKR